MIGINTAIHADGEGIGFAIPINSARRIVGALIACGAAPAPSYLGVQMEVLGPQSVRQVRCGHLAGVGGGPGSLSVRCTIRCSP